MSRLAYKFLQVSIRVLVGIAQEPNPSLPGLAKIFRFQSVCWSE